MNTKLVEIKNIKVNDKVLMSDGVSKVIEISYPETQVDNTEPTSARKFLLQNVISGEEKILRAPETSKLKLII